MEKNSFIFSLFIVLFLVFVAISQAQTINRESPIEFTISTNSSVYYLGEPVILNIEYQNISQKPIRVLNLTVIPGYPLWFDIFDAEGNNVPFCGPKVKYGINREKDFTELLWGEILRKKLDLTRDNERGVELYRFEHTGAYKITGHYSGFWGVPETRSNTIAIVISDRKNRAMNYSASKDLQEICQMTLGLNWLRGFYHDDSPRRKPLVILKNNFLKEPLDLKMFGQPALFLSENEIKQQNIEAYFIFEDVKLFEDSAIVEFRYPVEGVFGKVFFGKSRNSWKVISTSGGEE